MELFYWFEIKDKTHDASGIENPKEWLWGKKGKTDCYYPISKKDEVKSVWVCELCNSPNVQEKRWVDINNPSDIELQEMVEDEDNTVWCNDCEQHTNVHEVFLKKDAKVIGYQVVGEDYGFHEGEIHPDMAGSFCVYPLEWARKRLVAGEWRLLTVWEGDIENPTFVNE